MKKARLSSMMNSCIKNKHILRNELAAIRKGISSARREQARAALLSELHPLLDKYGSICSFHSIHSEIDTSALNQLLASEGRLILPKVEGQELDLFRVSSLKEQLARSSWNCLEPVPEHCVRTPLDTIDCILVPALGFDQRNRRIGYGKGYYDRLIAQAKSSSLNIHFIGIGFHEQMCPQWLLIELHDQVLDEILLF